MKPYFSSRGFFRVLSLKVCYCYHQTKKTKTKKHTNKIKGLHFSKLNETLLRSNYPCELRYTWIRSKFARKKSSILEHCNLSVKNSTGIEVRKLSYNASGFFTTLVTTYPIVLTMPITIYALTLFFQTKGRWLLKYIVGSPSGNVYIL